MIEFLTAKAGWIVAMAMGLVGRLLYHTTLVQRGRRKFFSRALLLELPIAVGMGCIAHGFCALLRIEGDGAAAIIAAVSYIGPHWVDAVYTVWLARVGGEKKD